MALAVALAVTLALGFLYKWRNGRVQAARKTTVELPERVQQILAASEGYKITLLQLSTTFCAPCRHTAAMLGQVAADTPEIRHVELDITDMPELATRLGVFRTPTTIAFDSLGRELLRVSGLPQLAQLRESLGTLLKSPGLA
ncbi:thioredoxin [Pseudonocardiaceae bacterium YIM PH 21723]|nr:thioredoxin [Pseudonocardiaceae bacterium YIM PH 21723]